MNKLAILGSGIVGHLSALYVKKLIPDIEVVLIGDPDRPRPLVGESTVEVTGQFLQALGLGALLEERHYHKYGLTYYFKQSKDPRDRSYVVHEAPGVIRLPSYNLNRFIFDRDLRSIVTNCDIETIVGRVKRVELGTGCAVSKPGRHEISVVLDDGEIFVHADWVVDATGRNRLLCRQLDLHKEPNFQRSTFWFRLSNFDRNLLKAINDTRVRHHCYDPYYVTHHFYGAGYWVWMIPMRSDTGKDLLSVGITYRPEILGRKNVGMDSFLEILDQDHPVISDVVRSGSIVDENRMLDYMYEAKQYYSSDGWFLVGDSAFTFDPANSAGLAYVAHQIPQIGAMILKDRSGTLDRAYVDALEAHLRAQLALQDTWAKWYEIMHDPVRMAWTLIASNMAYFHVVVPNYVEGAFLDGTTAKHFASLLRRYKPDQQPPAHPFPDLLDILSEQANGKAMVDSRVLPSLYENTINFEVWRAGQMARGRFVGRYFRKLARLRFKAMSFVRWQLTSRHARVFLNSIVLGSIDYLQGVTIGLFPHIYQRHSVRSGPLASPHASPGDHLLLPSHDAPNLPESRVSPPFDRLRTTSNSIAAMPTLPEKMAS